MDSLLAGYGSDSSGGEGGGNDETNQQEASAPKDLKHVPPATDGEEIPSARKRPRSPPTGGSSSSVAPRLNSSPGAGPPQAESAGAMGVVGVSPDPALSRLLFGPGWRGCYPPPETRSDDDDDYDATLVHWPNDYVTPLQRRACETLLLSSSSPPSSMSVTAVERRRGSRHRDEDRPSIREVAHQLQDSHEFTNPNQLKDAAQRLRITDALGSTIASPRESLGGGLDPTKL